MNFNLTKTQKFIIKAKKIHNNKYDYSNVMYENNKTKIDIICYKHGKFKQTPSDHLSGKGCSKCAGRFMNTEYFIEKAKKVHGDKYDYSLLEYKTSHTKIKILCPIHGEFQQKAYSHLNGKGCGMCGKTKKYTTETFIEKAKKIHNNKFDYKLTNYTLAHNMVIIICPIHGEFKQLPYSHIQGFGCDKCCESKGEKEINSFLTKNKIKFERQKRFDDCIDKRKLPFDFYLPDYNTCIEFDGIQHYTPIDKFGGQFGFIETKRRDKIKTKYCLEKGIKLIRIKYDENIDDKLKIYKEGMYNV